MAFDRPTLAQIVDRVSTDVYSRLSADDILRRSDAAVYARVVAGVTHGLYGMVDWLSRQLIYDTAEAEYLDRWASIWGITRTPAAAATGTVTLTALVGAVLPLGAVLQALDGVQYATTAAVTFTATTAVVAVQAATAAASGNRTTGQTFALVTSAPGVQSTATAGAMSGGADVETDDALRARLLTRIQTPPHGGSAADYVAWALEVPGVTRAWCYSQELGADTVTVRFVRDLDATLIPDAAEVAAVQAYLAVRRPVTAQLFVVAPVAAPLNFTIAVTPNTTAVKAAVQAELADLVLRESIPGSTLLLSHIRAAISAAAGETNYVMTAPVADVASATGNITTMGTITWA